MESFKRLTVWHPLNTDPADDNRWGPRIWFPTYDLLAIGLGLYAYTEGSPLLNRLFPEVAINVAAVILIISSVAMLVGVCFPKLMILELVGKMTLVFMLAAYAGTVAFMSKDHNGFVVIALIMSVWLLLPRITVLFAQLGRRRVAKLELRKVRG